MTYKEALSAPPLPPFKRSLDKTGRAVDTPLQCLTGPMRGSSSSERTCNGNNWCPQSKFAILGAEVVKSSKKVVNISANP